MLLLLKYENKQKEEKHFKLSIITLGKNRFLNQAKKDKSSTHIMGKKIPNEEEKLPLIKFLLLLYFLLL